MSKEVHIKVDVLGAEISMVQAEAIAKAIGWVPLPQAKEPKFQPGDYVLVRDYDIDNWVLSTFHSYADGNETYKYRVYGRRAEVEYAQCRHAPSWTKPE